MQIVVYAKQHWKTLAGGFFGLLVLYYLYENFQHASNASPTSGDLSGGANAVQSLSAAASLQNAQINGQVEVAQIQGEVSSQGIQAQLASNLALTAAQLSATNLQTAAGEAVALHAQDSAVTIQSIQSQQAVDQTSIQGATLVQLEQTQVQGQVVMEQTRDSLIGKQLQNIQKYSKHASQDYKAISPIIALETGQGYAAPGIAAANAGESIAKSPAAVLSASAGVLKGIGSIAGGLFG